MADDTRAAANVTGPAANGTDGATSTSVEEDAADVVRRWLTSAARDSGLGWESPEPGSFVVTLPGTRKLSTTCSLRVGRHSLSVNAFVIRHPDENDEAVLRWLLGRNLKLYGVAYAVDRLGDIYLSGRLPLSAVGEDELDRLLGSVLEEADGSFNTLLELGFASAIRKEYAWRVSRGESTRNLEAFTHLTQHPSS
ncbi:YbjN domain-containing protein [Streptomyces sp. NBC_01498]|uniref:YbjN domain-containing protein n=1 Tax=Streptomyces sp. NBC_01498 TaxID=2975870 RepID=UPI002E7B459A|nr:YbjN domain-containing protein [Streptomyces sp. NBC_01498]WTL26143.1 YbjN domain-containing protein [Streptomyces sp. NBC_01498]